MLSAMQKLRGEEQSTHLWIFRTSAALWLSAGVMPVTGQLTVLPLNSPKREGDSVVSLTTSLNDPDAALTPQGGNMQLYVPNHKGRALMPYLPQKGTALAQAGQGQLSLRVRKNVTYKKEAHSSPRWPCRLAWSI